MRRALLAPALLLAACAPGSPEPVAEPAVRTAYVGPRGDGYEVSLSRDATVSTALLDAPASRAWAALRGVYAEAGLAVSAENEEAKTLEAEGLTPRRLLGGNLSQYLNCGVSAGAEIADQYRVEMTLTSTVSEVSGGRSELLTRVSATAQARDGSGSGRVACASNGRFEARLARMLQDRLAGE